MDLYRRSCFWASISLLLPCFGLSQSASSFQHRTSHKLRATALLELVTDSSGTVTTRLVPITILANGRFHDASVYESRPKPMALGTGVVYEAQKTGSPVGYVTLGSASHTVLGWVGEGQWQAAKDTTQASSTPKPPGPRPSPGDDRPILHRSGENPQSSPPEASPPASDDRPVLHRNDSADNPKPSSESQSQAQPSSQPEPPEDPNRPVLRRRKPPNTEDAQSSPPPVAPKTPPSGAQPQSVSTKAPTAMPGTQTFVAVSDAQTSDSRSYEFHWKPGEQEQIEAKMRKLALAQLPGESAQLNEHAMTNVVIRAFDLDLSNDAVVVITAEVPGGYLAPGVKTGHAIAGANTSGKFVARYVTVIARVDVGGNPQKLAASVTDSSRLDVAPRLELIDAVDVDGDGLAELLFREYDFDQKSFVIYGVGHGVITKVFEGAGMPLK
jgi:hypothetical protein